MNRGGKGMSYETNIKKEDHEKSKCVSHRKRAMQLFEQGYNCSQSVFAAFSEELGLDFQTALKLASSFGGGMGRLREVCGAVTGMFMAAGLKYGYTDPNAMLEKTRHYQRIQTLAKRFEKENGSIICRELLGLDVKYDDPKPQPRTKEYYQSRPCSELVGAAAQMLDELFTEGCDENIETHKENS
jgi:C_GCAxxG_C_C family probable redox protein